jgi:hypothetical protein
LIVTYELTKYDDPFKEKVSIETWEKNWWKGVLERKVRDEGEKKNEILLVGEFCFKQINGESSYRW